MIAMLPLLVPMAWIEHATSPLPRECSTTELHGPICTNLPFMLQTGLKLHNYPAKPLLLRRLSPHRNAPETSPDGAGEGNRTLVISLEGFCSTIELHPHKHPAQTRQSWWWGMDSNHRTR